ncbi:hypothetical protein HYT23_02715 [Candidatus Pacearchaeota archaeon]|nr:hypothetical protein [Candidatus Pacearchaeota archaeon]
MNLTEFIEAVMPATMTSKKITCAGLSLKINLSGVVHRSLRDGIVLDGNIRGIVDDESPFFGKGGTIASVRMAAGGILITESAWTHPAVRRMGINSVLYEELVNTYFPQAQVVENLFGTYGGVNARLIVNGGMTAKQMAFYRLGWADYRWRYSLADFFVRPGANLPLISFPHMHKIF